MKLAVIPARGGSKRIVGKNIRPFHGQPMISYSINAALQANLFDDIIVSTDDAEIASIATDLGANVPFTRPPELCDDFTGIMEVVNHAIEWYNSNRAEVDYVSLIYATAPFVTAESLRQAHAQLIQANCSYVLSMTRFAFPIQRALTIEDNGSIDMFNPEHRFTRSQDLEEAYHDAGQFCLGKAQAFLKKEAIYSAKTQAFVLPEYLVQDIDTEEDWIRAEVLYKVLQQK